MVMTQKEINMYKFIMSYPCSKSLKGDKCQALDQKLLNKRDKDKIPPLHEKCFCYLVEEE